MSENRKRRAENDGAEDFMVLKIPHSTIENEILKEIVRELKNIREKIDENQTETDKKLDEMRVEMNEKMAEISGEVKKIRENRQEIENADEIVPKMEENLEVQNDEDDFNPIPIRDAILGTWKLVHYENFTGYSQKARKSFKAFSENLKYELVNGKLKQTGGGSVDILEEDPKRPKCWMYVENDHLKTGDLLDRYIQDGKLHFVSRQDKIVWKRIYEKIL